VTVVRKKYLRGKKIQEKNSKLSTKLRRISPKKARQTFGKLRERPSLENA
jgi:hypothetical protein